MNLPDPRGRHALHVRVDDRPGALERVLGMIRRNALGVTQLSLAGDHTLSFQLVIRTDGSRAPLERLRAEFLRLVDVREIREIVPNARLAPTRELALVRLRASAAEPLPPGSRILEVGDAGVLIELTGSPQEIDAALAHLRGEEGLAGYVRSGELALPLSAHDTGDNG